MAGSLIGNSSSLLRRNPDGTFYSEVGLTPNQLPLPVEGNFNSAGATAGEIISGSKAIYLNSGEAFIASPDTMANAQAVGIALTTSLLGENVKYQSSGELYDSSYSFTVGNFVYLDSSGSLTDTDPLTLGHDWRVVIGRAIATNGLFINIEEPIDIS